MQSISILSSVYFIGWKSFISHKWGDEKRKKKSEFFIYNKHCFHAFPQGKHKQTFPGSFSKERVLYATLRSFITGEICFVCAADWTNDIFKEWILSFALLLMFGISWNYIHYCDIKNQFVILNGNQERYYSNTWLTRAFEPRCKFIELLLVHIQAFYDIHRAVSVNESWGEFLSDQGAHSNASHQVPFNAAVNKTKEKTNQRLLAFDLCAVICWPPLWLELFGVSVDTLYPCEFRYWSWRNYTVDNWIY